jgi:quinol monooxygenase YgiN
VDTSNFVQVIDFQTDRIDEMRSLARNMEQRFGSTEHGPMRQVVLKDRNQPGRYLEVLVFKSRDDAMRTGQSPETSKFAEQMAALCSRPPAILDCDIVEMNEVG